MFKTLNFPLSIGTYHDDIGTVVREIGSTRYRMYDKVYKHSNYYKRREAFIIEVFYKVLGFRLFNTILFICYQTGLRSRKKLT